MNFYLSSLALMAALSSVFWLDWWLAIKRMVTQ
jgi:hypothetical protein